MTAGVVAALCLLPAAARADGLVVPFVGSDFGGDAGECSGFVDCSTKQLTYGVAFGFMASGVFGIETEIAYAPHFFGEGSVIGDNYVFTGMANLLVGVPLGPVRPYLVGGFGVIHTNASQPATGVYSAFGDNSVGFDSGGGVLGFFSQHVGVRGDIRYVRTLQSITFAQIGLNEKQLHFWRGSLGVVFRF